MSLAHRDQELALPASVHLAKAGAAVADRIALNVFVPEDRQRYVLALEKLAPSGGVARPLRQNSTAPRERLVSSRQMSSRSDPAQ
jgi:hypothetical protein